MNYDLYLFVDKLFEPQKGNIQTRDKAIASHARLQEIVRKGFRSGDVRFGDSLISAAERTIQRYEKEGDIGGFYYVVVLSEDMLDQLETKTFPEHFECQYPILAGYRLRCRDLGAEGDPDVMDELISLISWETMSSGPQSIHSIIQPKLEIYEQNAIAKAEELSNMVLEHQKSFDDQKLLHAQVAEATAKAQVELTTASHTFEQKASDLEDRSQDIDSNIRQLRADLDAQVARFGTEAARKLWGEREKQSRMALILSSIAISLLIAAPIGVAICFTPQVLHYLAQIVAASALPTTDANGQALPTPSDAQVTIAAIGRLVIVTVPIFLYVWAIRLVVRFNARSLMLLDDARLRLTMLDTFFHLIEKEGAVKEDRALVLNALFRPAPGHGDNVEPPNFTELVTKAIGTGK